MKLLIRSLLAFVATMTLSGCMVMMVPMLLWHGSHLKKKGHQADAKPQSEEVCECCESEKAEPRATPMGHGDHADREGDPSRVSANDIQ